MEHVVIVKVALDIGIDNALRAAIRWGGYGYNKVVHTNERYALLADEYVKLGPEELDIIDGFYAGRNNVSALVGADGKPIKLKD